MIKSDYLILGAGASGLMLAYRMANDSHFDNVSIVIIDKEQRKGNDRTWCYWEEGKGEWDDIVVESWSKIFFGSKQFSEEIPLGSYNYKMIRSDSFYKKLWNDLNNRPNIKFHQGQVLQLKENSNLVEVSTDKGLFFASKVFSSLMLNDGMTTQQKYPVLQQHFVGWFIKTEQPQFNPNVATFMDFDIEQQGNTRFMYILPTSQKEALFEYTLFSKDLLPFQDYESAIKDYLENKGISNYTIQEKEQGSIPMTAYKFNEKNSKNVLYIGTAGGWTKASTGYTFRNTTKKTKALVSFLKEHDDLKSFSKGSRFAFYDMLMLDVLSQQNEMGSRLFSSLFKNSKVKTIFRFLDEESKFTEELQIMASVPSWNFIKALFGRIF